MKSTKYFICRSCGNIVLSTKEASVLCCGQNMSEEIPKKSDENENLKIEEVENDWYITSSHPMEKDHYISFVAFISGSSLNFIKQYPEWNLQVRFPGRTHGTLFWYCTKHGLFYKSL